MKQRPVPRALRHLGLTLGAWTGFRILSATYPDPEMPVMPGESRSDAQFAVASIGSPASNGPLPRPSISREDPEARRHVRPLPEVARLPLAGKAFPQLVRPVAEADATPLPTPASSHLPAIVLPAPGANPSKADNWSLSAWAIYRPDPGQMSLSPTGQLGGSQFGFRVQRRLIEPAKALLVSINVRASTPLKQSTGKEGSFGIAIRRAGKVPIELIAERRIGLDRGGRNAFAGLAATGISDVPIASRFKLSGYAQAGIVGARKRDGFADGALRLDRDLVSSGPISIQVGGGVWGAVQPGVSRVDLGPSVSARFRLGSAGVRLGGEWRHRVSGNARPGSGPALTFGLDY